MTAAVLLAVPLWRVQKVAHEPHAVASVQQERKLLKVLERAPWVSLNARTADGDIKVCDVNKCDGLMP